MKDDELLRVLPPKTAKVFKKVADVVGDFYLSGGTGLALQLTHRQSEDLDFFSSRSFNPHSYLDRLKTLGKISQVDLRENTLSLYLNDVKLQFLTYPYKLLKPLLKVEKVWVSDKLDIALTKLITISQRGSKKDFVDLYFILQQISLEELFQYLEEKYQEVGFNRVHIIKSLTYFAEAEKQPMPRMIKECRWEEVKEKIVQAVNSVYTRQFDM